MKIRGRQALFFCLVMNDNNWKQSLTEIKVRVWWVQKDVLY